MAINKETKPNQTSQEDLDVAKKEKPSEINWISSNSILKQRHKDQLYKTKIVKS